MTRPLGILLWSDGAPLVIEGGGERVLWEQASRLAKRGHRVCIVSRHPAHGKTETVARQDVRIRHFPSDRRSLPRFLFNSIIEARRVVDHTLAEEGSDVV